MLFVGGKENANSYGISPRERKASSISIEENRIILQANIKSTNEVVELTSNPEGAIIFTDNYQKIGVTPTSISKSNFSNRSLFFYGSEIVRVDITPNTTMINIDFQKRVIKQSY